MIKKSAMMNVGNIMKSKTLVIKKSDTADPTGVDGEQAQTNKGPAKEVEWVEAEDKSEKEKQKSSEREQLNLGESIQPRGSIIR